MALSGRGMAVFAARAFVACPRCEANVRLPANYCDMCGGRIVEAVASRSLRIAAKLPVRPEVLPAPVRNPVVVGEPSPSTVHAGSIQESLRTAYLFLQRAERMVESTAAATSRSGAWSAILDRIVSGVKARPEIAELERTLNVVMKEAKRASGLDPDAVVETDEGPLNAAILMSRSARTRGNMAVYAGSAHEAIDHYMSSIDGFENQDAYFDLAFAYEAIGQPGKALHAYDSCAAISPDTPVGIDALREAEALRSQMMWGGWFVGSRNVVIMLGACTLSGFVILPIFPLVGMLYVVFWGGILGAYCLAKYRR
jgi:hypothetical protein